MSPEEERDAPKGTGSYTLKAETGFLALEGQPVALILNGPSRIEVNDFVGKAHGRVNDDGTLDLRIEGRPRRGRHNEDSVLKVLRTTMASHSHVEVSLGEGDDAWCKDGAIFIW